jgi:CheY-like chemotaxis protein
LRLDLADRLPLVYVDPKRFQDVIGNLLQNAEAAIAARREGKSRSPVVAAEARGVIEISTRLEPDLNRVVVDVADNGSGLKEEDVGRVFDPFFTTREVGVGTGLGLSLVHGIVTDLGGGIDVESAPGQGASFTVYLPWSSAAAVSSTKEEPVPFGGGETVLLVDDEEALVRLGEEVIASLGYEPVGFTSSTEALAAFRESPERFQAVLSDEAMPDMTGSDLVREIRALRPDIPIVLVSGYVTPQFAARARDLGVAEVLAKPLVARDIARSLATALRRTSEKVHG